MSCARWSRGVLALLLSWAGIAAAPALADGPAVAITKSVVNPKTSYAKGDTVTYRLSVVCNSITDPCKTATVTDVLDPRLTYTGFVVTHTKNSDGEIGTAPVAVSQSGQTLTFVVGKDDAEVNYFMDGETLDILITARVGTIPADGTIPNQASIALPSGTPADSETVTIPVTTVQPVNDWGLVKTKSSPSGDPAFDGKVTYDIRFTRPGTSSGTLKNSAGYDIDSFTIADVLPAGAVYDSASIENGSGTISYDSATNSISVTGASVSADNMYCGNGDPCITYWVLHVTVKYPASAFDPDGDGKATVTNTATADVVYDGSTDNTHLTDSVDVDLSTKTPRLSGSKSTVSSVQPAAGETIAWDVTGSNSGNTALVDAELIDTLPAGLHDWKVSTEQWYMPSSDNSLKRTFEYSTDNGTTWQTLGAGDLGQASTATLAVPAGATNVRLTVHDVAIGGAIGFRITGTVDDDAKAGEILNNCMHTDGTTGPSTPDSCSSYTVQSSPQTLIFPDKNHVIDTSTLQPGDEFDWLLEWRSLTNGGEPVTTVKDLLPSQFELVTEEAPCLDVIGTWDPDPAACSSSATTPAYTTEDVSGGTLITFKDIDLPALGSTSWNAQFDHKFVIRLHVRVKDGTPVKTYTNTMSVIPEGYVPVCNWGSTAVDSYGGCPADDSVEVVAAAAVGLQKWDKGVEENVSQTTGKASSSCPNWNGFTRYPCVAQTLPGGDLTYRLKLSNQGNQTLTNEVVYDVLPYIGDTGVSDALDDQSRGTEWSPVLTGPITVDASLTTATNANAVVEYNLTTNPCRPELKAGSADGDWQASCDDTWYAASDITDWSTVRSFRVTAFQSGAQWAPGDRVVLTVPMKAPANAPTSTITKSGVDLSVAWNSAAQRAYRVESDGSTTRMQATEPRKVGVIIPAPYVSIGDYVWYDANYNGKQDDGEKPAAGVQVTLKDASGTVVGTTTTDSDGYYWFQNLTEKTAYTLTFAKPDGYGWTIQNAGTDDAIDSDVDPSTSTISFTSPAWVENVSHNLGGHDVADDTTLDAGLVAPRPLVSVGDYVWYDTNRDGLQTSGEKPVKDVTVNLYDADNKLVDTTKTDDSGHYWFTNLVSGNQYTIGFVKPDGTVFTTPDAGNDVSNSATTDLTDSDAPANGKVTFVAEASGANLGGADKADNPGIDAGLLSYNLVLDKSLDTTGTVRIGDDVTYTLSPSNEGPVNALAGWSVTDVLPAGLTLKSMSGTGYTCDLATATCTSSSPLGVGKGQPITVVATVGAGTSGSLKNVAYVAPIASDTVSETNPLSTPPTVATDTRTSPTDNDAQAAVTVSPLVSIGDYVWWGQQPRRSPDSRRAGLLRHDR